MRRWLDELLHPERYHGARRRRGPFFEGCHLSEEGKRWVSERVHAALLADSAVGTRLAALAAETRVAGAPAGSAAPPPAKAGAGARESLDEP